MRYDLNKLGSEEFEHMIQSLVQDIAGIGYQIFGDGPDGQREGVIEDASFLNIGNEKYSGKCYIQAKYKADPNKGNEWAWIRNNLKNELDRFKEKQQQDATYIPNVWWVFTNIILTPKKDTGLRDKVNAFLEEYKTVIPHIFVYGADDICAMLDNNRNVAKRYAEFITPGDILLQLMQSLEQEKNVPYAEINQFDAECEEGQLPYVFIAYSRKNDLYCAELCRQLKLNNIRFWYDRDINIGEDYQRVIANRIESATAILLLLSEESVQSEYVKNEIHFAISHRIPIFTLVFGVFQIPSEIELMIGRYQMAYFHEKCVDELLRDLPPELVTVSESFEKAAFDENDLIFQKNEMICVSQGTYNYHATHKIIGYSCVLQEEQRSNYTDDDIKRHAKIAGGLSCKIFPQLLDIKFENGIIRTWVKMDQVTQLSEYLNTHTLSEKEIVQIVSDVIDGIIQLWDRGLALKEFSRGSVFISDDGALYISRMQNPYYGPFKVSIENKRYYFENTLHEIAVLIYQLCTGNLPMIPIRFFENSDLSLHFVRKMNLIIQKASRENNVVYYKEFEEILVDLKSKYISMRDILFLSKRHKKMIAYDKAKDRQRELLQREDIHNENVVKNMISANAVHYKNLEDEYGFDRTVVLLPTEDEHRTFSIGIAITGQVVDFYKNRIIIGRDTECDLTVTQRYFSMRQLIIEKQEDGSFMTTNLGTNTITYTEANDFNEITLLKDEPTRMNSGANIIVAGQFILRLML